MCIKTMTINGTTAAATYGNAGGVISSAAAATSSLIFIIHKRCHRVWDNKKYKKKIDLLNIVTILPRVP